MKAHMLLFVLVSAEPQKAQNWAIFIPPPQTQTPVQRQIFNLKDKNTSPSKIDP